MYKLSRYNYFIDYKDRKLFFNGLKGNGFCMTMDEYNHLQRMLSDLKEFEQQFPDDFERLKGLGYIVEESFDEVAYIRFMNKQQVFADRHYHLIINPTLSCNFKCWYCYEENKGGKMSNATILRIKKHIKNKVEKEHIPSLHIGWFGGEPLLGFQNVVYPISMYAKRLCKKNNIPFSSSITTNGFLINKDMVEKIKRTGLSSFQITLDGDKEKHNSVRNNNGEPSYERIIENIRLICTEIKHSHINLRINYDEKTFTREDIFSLLEEFPQEIRTKININTQRVWQTSDKKEDKEKNLLPKFISSAHEKGYRLTCQGSLNIGSFYTCYASRMNYANINYDGKVYKCTARDYTDKNFLGELDKNGNIIWQMDKIAKMYSTSSMENKECLECEYLPLCCGQCIQNFIEHGSACRYRNNRQNFFNEEIKRYYTNLRLNHSKQKVK